MEAQDSSERMRYITIVNKTLCGKSWKVARFQVAPTYMLADDHNKFGIDPLISSLS